MLPFEFCTHGTRPFGTPHVTPLQKKKKGMQVFLKKETNHMQRNIQSTTLVLRPSKKYIVHYQTEWAQLNLSMITLWP